MVKKSYNIPRTCLLNRLPVPAMVASSNKSGLWRHLIETCRRLRWLCRKRPNNVAWHDIAPIRSIFLWHDKNILLRETSLIVSKEYDHVVTKYKTCGKWAQENWDYVPSRLKNTTRYKNCPLLSTSKVSQIASIESENLLTFDGSTLTPSFSLRPCLHYTWSIIGAPRKL